jgi:signal recognition particle subunit SRP54
MFDSLTQRLGSVFAGLTRRGELTSENVESGLEEVRAALLEADVHYDVVRDFVARVRERVVGSKRLPGVSPSQQFVHACHQELVELMGPEAASLSFAKRPPTLILLAGLQGAGKTTTCAKLALHLRSKWQKRPLMIAADVKRPAAVEQLRVLGQKIDVPVFFREKETALQLCRQGVAAAASGGQDVVLIDTAGRLHIDDEMMDEVCAISSAVSPHNRLLVVDAMTGQDAVRSAGAFHRRLELSGVILTKLDGDARAGAALSLKAVTGRPILFVGTGERVEDLDTFEAERMAGRILGMGDVTRLVEQAQEAISETEARATYEKMVLGSFTLEDMLAQMRMVRRLGPMKKVLGMLPGLSSMAGSVDVDEKKMQRLEALFTSMTPRERLHPELLEMSRRRRIARGAGQDVGAVNELLKSFKAMKGMMKEMNKLGVASRLGARGKRETLAGLSPSGELAGGEGFLSGLFSGGSGSSGAGSPFSIGRTGSTGSIGSIGEGQGPRRPKGFSPTRKRAQKRKKRKR